MNWYYVENDQQVGPVTREQLEQLLQAGRITLETLVWQPGQENWLPLRAVNVIPPPAPPTGPAAAPPTLGQDEVVCAECGKIFPASETIQHGPARICAACKPVFLQKLAEGARVNTGELDYASFGERFAAKFVDGLIVGLPLMVIMFVIMIPMVRSSNANGGDNAAVGLIQIFVQLGFILVNMAYQIFFLGKFNATPGKMLCKIKVVTADGKSFGYGRATGRFFAEMLSGMTCYIGYLLVLFDKEKRALHDHICNTRVVHK